MEQGFGSNQNAHTGPIDKSRVLDVRPLRCLAPLFPNPPGESSITNPNPAPFVCVPPCGPFPPGVQPFYPFMNTQSNVQNPPNSFSFGNGSNIPAPVPLNSFRTPPPHQNGGPSGSKRASKARPVEDDGYSDSHEQNDAYVSGFSMHVADGEGGSSKSGGSKRKGVRPQKRKGSGNFGDGKEIDVEAVINSFLTSFKLKEFDESSRTNGNKNITGTILFMYDLLRRRISHLEEVRGSAPGVAKRPDLKASNLMMTKGIRTNSNKRVGHVPGIEVGDIFFFRMELCLVGVHAQSMGGIDYMSVKISTDEEPVAVSIVSSGGYDDDGDNSDVLIYSGQGGVTRRDGQMFDQKLERGNLALEKSLHRGNDVRVIRGIQDAVSTGKIYVYDGLYRIQESWAEKNKSGLNVFKYKLVRQPGQPEAFSLWKSIQQFRDGNAPRPGVIIPDLASGLEAQPVALVNDVDGEKGPAHFTYISTLKYTHPFVAPKPSSGCNCVHGCQPGDPNCFCNKKNDGSLPYNPLGVLLTGNNAVIHECGPTCQCPSNCRARLSQMGIKHRLEVFKTKNRGWGLRSWDPIRAGAFICEYAGDVIKGNIGNGNDSDDSYVFDASRYYEPGEPILDSSGYRKSPFPLVISAKNNGNVARFINHGCAPNVFWQPVLRDSNSDSYLHVVFFAIRHIPPMQELTFDYGIVQGDRGRKKCLCGSMKCKGYFY